MTNENAQSANLIDTKEVTLNLTVGEVNLVLGGLGELPAKLSINLIEKIRMQATAQLQQTDQNVQ